MNATQNPAKPAYKRAPQRLFYIEVTDTFAGEANYSWVTRHIIRASTERGAVNKFSRLSGMEWRGAGCERYDSKSGATCFFLSAYDHDAHSNFLHYATDERPTTSHFYVHTTHGDACVPCDLVTYADEAPTDKVSDTLALFLDGDMIGEYTIQDSYISPDWERVARNAYRANTGKDYKGQK
jgi:hypothetical protein